MGLLRVRSKGATMQVPTEQKCPMCDKTKKGLGLVAHLEYDHNVKRREVSKMLRDVPHEERL